jgi:hypothetical protein
VIKTSDAVKHLVKVLSKDAGYRISWTANIAMAYIDCEEQYRKKCGKRNLSRTDRHIVANDAAKHFLWLLGVRVKGESKS